MIDIVESCWTLFGRTRDELLRSRATMAAAPPQRELRLPIVRGVLG